MKFLKRFPFIIFLMSVITIYVPSKFLVASGISTGTVIKDASKVTIRNLQDTLEEKNQS
jgi:hypothetical protein